jgi:hypothetical protein
LFLDNLKIRPIYQHGIIIRLYIEELSKAEYKLFFSAGEFVILYHEDIQHHYDMRSATLTSYGDFLKFQPYILSFCSDILKKLTTFPTNVVTSAPILRLDLTMKKLNYTAKANEDPFPFVIGNRDIVVNQHEKIRLILNEITSSLDIQFGSVTHNFNLPKLTALNLYSLIVSCVRRI